MKLLTFATQTNPQFRLGIKTKRGVIDVTAVKTALGPAVVDAPATIEAALASGRAAAESLANLVEQTFESESTGNWLLDEADLILGPCVPNPGKILCVGLNYRRHAAESRMTPPDTPLFFSKFNNSIAASNEIIPLPSNAERYDYEAELAVVIGQRAKYIAEANALDYVFGYCNANDLSARELQKRTSQWLLGKSLDKFFPTGPYLVTADEIEEPQNLSIKCWVNGGQRQNSNTADMLFSVARLISYASQYMTLEAGDIISTGTPEGVILGMEERVWLKPGDEVVIEVEGLGRLTNVMGIEPELRRKQQ